MFTAVADPGIPYPSPNFSRPTWAEINIKALRDNVRSLQETCGRGPGRPHALITVIKADAYGHGAVECARVLAEMPQVNMLAVASVDEAIVLREAGITPPILLLSAILPEEAEAVVAHGLTATVSSMDVAFALDREAGLQNRTVGGHWKIDSGMGRVGTRPEDVPVTWKGLTELEYLRIEGIYTHFATADEADESMTLRQIETFNRLLDECQLVREGFFIHAANSAAALRFSEARFNAVRCGIALYGASPFGTRDEETGFVPRPVMSLKSRVTDIRKINEGQPASYGATWVAPRDSRLALVPVGYADGYLRILSSKGKVLIRGQECLVAGRVTMDQILVDVTDISPNVEAGEIVTVWGEDGNGGVMPVEEVAELAGTISYELLCRVAPRVPRIYIERA